MCGVGWCLFFLFVVGKVGCGFCPGFVSCFFSFFFFFWRTSVKFVFCFCVFFELGVFIKLSCVCVFVGGGEEFSKLFLCSCGKEILLELSYRLKDT